MKNKSILIACFLIFFFNGCKKKNVSLPQKIMVYYDIPFELNLVDTACLREIYYDSTTNQSNEIIKLIKIMKIEDNRCMGTACRACFGSSAEIILTFDSNSKKNHIPFSFVGPGCTSGGEYDPANNNTPREESGKSILFFMRLTPDDTENEVPIRLSDYKVKLVLKQKK